MNVRTGELVQWVVALLQWGRFSNVRVVPWAMDTLVAQLSFDGPYMLLISGSDVLTYTPGISLCESVDDASHDGYPSCIAVWNAPTGEIVIPVAD